MSEHLFHQSLRSRLYRFFALASLLVTAQAAQTAPVYTPETGPIPALHITRVMNNEPQKRVLQEHQNMCLVQVNLYREQAAGNADMKAFIERMARDEWPDFSLDRALEAVEDWSKIGQVRTEEYFDGPRYARYVHRTDYTVATDGSCKLLEQKQVIADIDDGVHRYRIDLVRKQGTRSPSPALAEKNGQLEIDSLTDTTDRMLLSIARSYAQGARDNGANPSELLEHPVTKERVAGEWCDRMVVKDSGAMICLWSRSPVYPGAVARPVVLWSQNRVGTDTAEDKATSVRRLEHVPDEFFTPPADVRFGSKR